MKEISKAEQIVRHKKFFWGIESLIDALDEYGVVTKINKTGYDVYSGDGDPYGEHLGDDDNINSYTVIEWLNGVDETTLDRILEDINNANE